MAKNVTFAHVLLIGTMLKISIKLISYLAFSMQLIPHGPGVLIPLPPRVLETVKDFVSEKSCSNSQLTESSEYECVDDQQPKPIKRS